MKVVKGLKNLLRGEAERAGPIQPGEGSGESHQYA